jgi:hypothetical protein
MILKNWFFIFTFFLSNVAFAQRKLEQMDPEKKEEQQKHEAEKAANRSRRPDWMDKVSFGGNIGGNIASWGSFFVAQPMALYRFTDITMAGIGGTYMYSSRNYQTTLGQRITLSDNIYGLNIFARQLIFEPAFVHVEYNPLNFSVFNSTNGDSKRNWVNAFYIGGGINQSISDRSSIYIMILYDVLHDPNRSFRQTPIDFRTGFFF